MKYLKLYENFENEPKIGDYVYCYNEKDADFINNSIGQYRLVNPNYPSLSKNKYMIYYDDAPVEILPSKRISMNSDNIIAFAPTIEELKVKIKQIKYNI